MCPTRMARSYQSVTSEYRFFYAPDGTKEVLRRITPFLLGYRRPSNFIRPTNYAPDGPKLAKCYLIVHSGLHSGLPALWPVFWPHLTLRGCSSDLQ